MKRFIVVLLLGALIVNIAEGGVLKKNKVYKLIKEMDRLCKKTESLEELGWSVAFNRICMELKNLGAEAVPYMLEGVRDRTLNWKTRFTLVSMFPYQDLGKYDTLVVRELCRILEDKSEDSIIRSKIPVYAFAKMKEKRAISTLIKVMMDESNPVIVRVKSAKFFVCLLYTSPSPRDRG